MAYLKQIEIAGVQEVGVDRDNYSAYTQRVEIVEVFDQQGRVWVPGPGQDPWDELVVKSDTYWSNLNDYSPGSEVFAHPAVFTGGNPENTTYRYRWQYQADDSSTWNSGSWTSYNNGVLEVSYVIPNEAAGGKVRLMSQARDTSDPEDVIQVNSFATAEDVAYMPLVLAQEATWSESNVYTVGETISGTSATFTGGTGNETYRSRVQYKSATDSDWTNTPWTNHLNVPKVISGVIPPGKEGSEVRFKTQAADLTQENYVPVNSIAPTQDVLAAPVMTPVVQKLNGDVVDTNQALEVSAGTHNLEVIANALPSDIDYQWSLRTGTGQLTHFSNDPSRATYTTGPGEVAPLIACTLDSDISENTSVSWQLFIL